MKVIICLYGGPGSGKSTTCAGVYYHLKQRNLNVEMNREYIKDWAWEGREVRPGDQTYFFAKQSRRERQYMRQGLDVIVTDAPLILTHFYGMKYDPYEAHFNTSLAMLAQHHAIGKDLGYKVEHILLERSKPYNPAGRYQTEGEALGFDLEIRNLLDRMGIQYVTMSCADDVAGEITKHILKKYDKGVASIAM